MNKDVAEISQAYQVEAAEQGVPVGYKQTEVGVIPEDWLVLSISENHQIATGNTPPPSDKSNYGESYLFASPADLGEKKNIYQTEKMLSSKGFALSRKFPAGSTLFTCIGSTIGKTGYACVDLTSNQQINAVFPNVNNDSHFTYYALTYLAPRVKVLAGEQAVPLVNKTEFGETKYPLPVTKEEQTAIANALSDVDALLSELEKLIAKKEAIKTATMQQLLTGRTRLPQFTLHQDGSSKGYKQSELGEMPEDWEVVPFGSLLSIRHGKSQKDVEVVSGKYPILATGGQIGWANSYLYNKPSVLIGRKGTIDKPRYADTPFWTVDTLFYSEIKSEADAKFIYYKFCMIEWMQYNEASGVPSLNASTIERVLAAAPDKKEQTAIASILSDIDAEIQALEHRLNKTRKIKQGMMQELLTGKTRLVKGGSNE